MRTSFIADAKETSITYDEKIISPSSAGIPTRIAISTGGGPVISGDAEIPLGTLQATGRIEVSGSGTNNPETGDFGETTVNVSFREGANGFQALGKDLQEGAFVARQVGKVVETVAPPGTIDLNATIKITGGGANINVSAPSREARPFPSYTGYAYYYGADGKLVTQKLFYRDETVPADLPKPMTPIP